MKKEYLSIALFVAGLLTLSACVVEPVVETGYPVYPGPVYPGHIYYPEAFCDPVFDPFCDDMMYGPYVGFEGFPYHHEWHHHEWHHDHHHR